MENNSPTPPPSATPTPPPGGAEQPKAFAILGYIIPLLFFIPLLTEAKNNPAAKFHANQQLNLLLFWVAINVLAMIPILGWILYPFAVIAGFILMIIGIMNVAKDQQKPLPLIGGIHLLQ